jgi:signal transduction histidine kinase
MLNIAVNARDAMPDGGRFIIAVDNQTIVPGQIPTAPDLHGAFVRMQLSDTGRSIAPDVAARAFEPFFTTKAIWQRHRPRPQPGLWLCPPSRWLRDH